MAKIPQGILGGIRGRVGNVIGAAWKGINYIRSMPLSVANPNTAAQQAQRGAFTQTVLVARLLLADLIATYWDPFAREMSGYNHFISVNIAAFATSGLDSPVDFSAARGILTGIIGWNATFSEAAGVMAITWVDNSGVGDALATDVPVYVWYNVTQDYWRFLYIDVATRSSATEDVPDVDAVVDDVIELWVFFRRPDLSKISDSAKDQITVVA